MNFEAQASLLCYEKVAELNPAHQICIVRNINSGKIYVRKALQVFSLPVYETLKAHPVAGTPHIEELISDGDTLIIIEEYVSGNTLSEILAQKKQLSEQEAVSCLLQLCRIVEDLHAAQPPIIHRDIKPSNIILRYDGSVCLLDFNAAKYEVPSQDRDTVLLGTGGYAAPEQYGFGASNERTDIYALGKLLNTMITGDVEHPADQSSSLFPVIRKATDIDPSARYSSVSEFRKALMHVYGSRLQTKKTTSSGASWIPPGFRTGNPLHMIAAAGGYILIFWFSITFSARDRYLAELIIDRISYLVTFLGMVAFSFNYRGLGSYNLFHDDKVRSKRILGIILTDLLIFLLLMIIWALVANIFGET